jgi:hypothetical protein
MDSQFYQEVARRAHEDPDFRERLLEDPKSIVAEIAGIEIDDDTEVVILEDGPKKVHVILPPDGISLTELDEMAAGRRDAPSWFVCWGL